MNNQLRLTRRDVLKLSVGAALAAAGQAIEGGAPAAWAQGGPEDPIAIAQRLFVKDITKNYYALAAPVAGAHWWKFTTDITPVERLFLRSRYKTPIVDKSAWKLTVSGDAIDRPMEFTYGDLLKMRSLRAVRYHECNGNGGIRGFGLIGQVEWHYVPIGEILGRVRVRPNGVQALFWSGVDGPDTGRPIDLAELRSRPEVIGLAYGMNGSDLPADHGGPVRLIVPGWGGSASIKWLTEIRIASHRFWTRMNTKEEALIGPQYAPDTPGASDELTLGVAASDIRGQTAKWQTTKSHLNLPIVLDRLPRIPPGYPLQQGVRPIVNAGRRTMSGYAYSPMGIRKVEYSTDGGRTWTAAVPVGPIDRPGAWTRFQFSWDATPGDHTLLTRATDGNGTVQPGEAPLNELRLQDNSIPRFEVRAV
jgi:DMSO/TMAO reductase YedYZ molybdopterin-dependent catalytic subunit